MYTLTYESQANPDLKNSDIEEILKTARAFNSDNGITGCLIYYLGKFIQILEGPEEKVKELYSNIEKDKRHKKVNLFSEDTITERNFPDWGMAYYPIDEDHMGIPEFEQFKRNLMLLADLSKPTNVTAVLFWKRMKFLLAIPPTK
ncbi:BLUF domain-containing protein [Euzebyella saccharophila]|uniref:BLUF domain-containing protein n=1 Tax=Euzebyella saccharophila TaxID=679664 RepID=A0ABV8JZR5_9FLAO|nr:BLUF domain-containing protein [Euzebyella saccharophila]